MKVLLLHQHFNTPESGGAIRSYYLAKALVERGIETVVITASNIERGVKRYEGIEVHYLPIPYNNSFGFIKRSIAFVRFMNAAVNEARRIEGIDLCYAISVPLTVGVAAIRLKKKIGMPFIFEVGDLWPAAPIEMGFIRNKWFKNYLLNKEKEIYEQAESVVALSEPIAQQIRNTAPSTPVHCIPNMADTNFYSADDKDENIKRKFNMNDEFVISYVGSLGLANGLDQMLDCAKASRDTKLKIKFFICGEGALRNHLRNRIAAENLSNVSLQPFTNRDGVHDLLHVTDAAFISYLPFKILETGSPNKYFDALAAGKLVIINFGGWIKNEIEENRVGFSFSTIDEFLIKVQEVLASPAEVQLTKSRARALALSKYSREKLSAQFVEVVEATVNTLP